MYNDFIIVGPAADPAKIGGGKDAVDALKKIAATSAPFVSRADDSGTHKAELRLWKEAGIDATAASGTWYRETGQGMGATINMAVGMNAYVLSDRATWSAFKNKVEHKTVLEGDQRLFNQYGVILVNPEKHPNVKKAEGQAFVDWLLSKEGQDAIAAFNIEGEQQFFPNAAMKSDLSTRSDNSSLGLATTADTMIGACYSGQMPCPDTHACTFLSYTM